jgi:hypothetical protein
MKLAGYFRGTESPISAMFVVWALMGGTWLALSLYLVPLGIEAFDLSPQDPSVDRSLSAAMFAFTIGAVGLWPGALATWRCRDNGTPAAGAVALTIVFPVTIGLSFMWLIVIGAAFGGLLNLLERL